MPVSTAVIAIHDAIEIDIVVDLIMVVDTLVFSITEPSVNTIGVVVDVIDTSLNFEGVDIADILSICVEVALLETIGHGVEVTMVLA